MKRKRIFFKALPVTVLILLAGCAASAPVSQHESSAASDPGIYHVQRGDTLYSIAFRHRLDWREIAHLNEIGPPHTIYPGQPLRLPSVPHTETVDASEPETTEPLARIEHPDVGEPRDLPVPSDEPEPVPESRAEPLDTPVLESEPEIAQTPDTEPVPESESEPVAKAEPEPDPEVRAPAPPAAERSVAGIQWRWPAAGQMVRGFDDSATRKGIAIAGNEGQPVMAAADGQVVYSGTGLLGYGELIIIKHSDSLLSAYGHNRRRLVDEGEHIGAGEAIAEMGRNERNEVLLHFEIRNNGQPANPLQYLPQR